MPVHDLGYRTWRGERAAHFLRPLVVARAGIALVFKRRWLRIMLVLAWLPVLFPAFGIFAFEYSSTEPELQDMIVGLVSRPLQQPELGALIRNDPEAARHQVWSTLILMFFRYPQLFAMVALIGLIAPLLVSYDLRTKAYLMYFSRPLSPTQYIIGKSAVIWCLLGMVVTLPALLLYGMGVLLSPDLSVVQQTWDIPLRIFAASFVLLIPTTTLAILFSSLTAESRYATFCWFATWALGFVAYQILTFSPAAMSGDRPRRRRGPVDWEAMGVDLDRWRLLSPYHTLGKVQAWIFGLDTTSASVIPCVVLLVAITVVGFWIVRRRILARLSV
ncbi:ABC transporter permease subunit [Stieleria sp. TO1_6]|uniref:ABC transporter permease subunit n=1 Tax=Stieleria tagensis TaxID=2956795 RepID=UPI00209B6DE7|nr:ABC transporter permease subunit [Stieleria tagensis]MCO8122229.1 ABC transporter permease subunit [Stieleria tagensis]